MQGKYLDPKADLTFKLIFEHEDLLISLLNALLPLDEGKQIEHLEYLPAELVPENPGKKDSVVDVRCRETGGREFIVEMQLNWNNEFRQRVILNSAKAVVKQLETGEKYKLIQPVYSLNLINDTGFESDPDEFYHDYAIVDVAHTDRIIEGLRFVFIELPKFKPVTIKQKKMAVLWLRFLTEINAKTEEAPAELLENPDTAKALKILERSAYTEGQLIAYDRFWDAVYRERVFYDDGFKKGKIEGRDEGRAEGLAEGRAEGLTEGLAEGMEKGEDKANRENAIRMKNDGMPAELIAKYTGLSMEVVNSL
jgi:predicted transposase/invertase (TIGR01784 family)